VVRESFLRDLEGVPRAARFARVSLATALKSLHLALIVSLGGLLVRRLFVNRSVPVLAFARVIISPIVDFERSDRRLISLYEYPAKYHAQTSLCWSYVVSRREVFGFEGIFLVDKG